MTNDSKIEYKLREGLSRLDQLEAALSEEADTTKKYESLGEMIWGATDLLRYCSDKCDERPVLQKLKSYSHQRHIYNDEHKKVLSLPLDYIGYLAQKLRLGPSPAPRKDETSHNRHSDSKLEAAVAKHVSNPRFIVAEIVTRELRNSPEASSGLPYLNEYVLDAYQTRSSVISPVGVSIYNVLLDLDAIQKYPKDYSSRPVEALRNALRNNSSSDVIVTIRRPFVDRVDFIKLYSPREERQIVKNISMLVSAQRDALRKCYKAELERNPGARGQVELDLAVYSDGDINSFIYENDIFSTMFQNAVQDTVEACDFDGLEGLEIVIPIGFRPKTG